MARKRTFFRRMKGNELKKSIFIMKIKQTKLSKIESTSSLSKKSKIYVILID
jgi:hypothetical protein